MLAAGDAQVVRSSLTLYLCGLLASGIQSSNASWSGPLPYMCHLGILPIEYDGWCGPW